MKKNVLSLCLLFMAIMPSFAQHYVGGDISLLSKYEEHGAKYLDNNGNDCGDMLTFFKSNGLNAMRVRLFVNPSNASSSEKEQGVFQDLAYVKALGKRIKDAGLSFLLDFHYSDSWADPGKQRVPAAWNGLTDEQLATKIYDYTKDCLQQLNAVGATPDFIQTGNEISYGMLFGEWSSSKLSYYAGKEANRTRFVNFLKQAVKACREECPQAKIVLHTERVANNSYTVDFYKDMNAASVDYDIIGLSYYPIFHGLLSSLEKTLTAIEANFPSKKVHVVETGYAYAWMRDGDYKTQCASMWPVSESSAEGQDKFVQNLIASLKKFSLVEGLFWWQMDANEYGLDWNTKRVLNPWWDESLFDNRTGRATAALSSLKNFLTDEQLAGVHGVEYEAQKSNSVYNLNGQKVGNNYNGIIIKGGKKMIKH